MHESLKLQAEPRPLRDPILLVAFRGWNDATGTAVMALRYLREQWGATELAELDPEPFYDFTVQRPFRRNVDGDSVVRWPTGRFYGAAPAGAGRDFVLLSGREPGLRWQMFAEAVADLAGAVGASACLCIGTRGAATPHKRPSPVDLSNADPKFEELFGLRSCTPADQGPTRINTVLSAHLRSLGTRTGQPSALVPHYVGAANPKAMLALVETLDRGFGTSSRLSSSPAASTSSSRRHARRLTRWTSRPRPGTTCESWRSSTTPTGGPCSSPSRIRHPSFRRAVSCSRTSTSFSAGNAARAISRWKPRVR